MLKFHQINEKAGDTAIFTFGRFNPPTTGHEKLIDALAREQSKNSGSKMYVFPSQSQNPKKDPLPFALKVAYMRKMFPKYAKNILANKKVRMVFDIAVELHNKGHRSIVMVVGSDRVAEFDGLLNKYNGVNGRHGYYGFDNIEVVSAGERDPDAEGVSGMSASKMRAAASGGDFDSFKTGVPSGFKDALKLYNDVRKNMGIREEKDMGEMTDFESLRDLYLTGKLWNIGDIVEAKGVSGKVINKGTNYLSFVDDNNKVHKTWLYDIVERNYAQEYANYQGTPEQIARRSSRNKARRIMGDKVVKGMDVGHKDNNPMNNDPSNLRNEDPSVNRKEPRLREVKQDKDIKSRDGTQPAKYYAKDTEGDTMSKSTKQARARHFDKKKKGPAPGDASATTKPSKHTQKFKQMYGEILGEDPVIKIKTGEFAGRYMVKYIYNRKKETGIFDTKAAAIKHAQAIRKMKGAKLDEKLPKDADMGDYIDDFKKSDAPQFKGKSKEKRKDMAIAAYLDKNESLLDKVNTLLSEDGHTDVASMKNKVKIAMSALQKMQSELGKLGDENDLPTWWTNKVSTAVSRLDDMSDYLDTQVEDYTHYPTQVDPKQDKSDGWIVGDPPKPITFDGSDTKSILDKANKEVEKERGVKQKPFTESYQIDEALTMTVKGKGKEKYRLGYDQKFTMFGKSYISSGVAKQQVYVAKGPEGERVFSQKEFESLLKKGDIKMVDTGVISQEELQMEFYQLDEKIEGLVTKAKKSGMPYGILKKVYDRGMAAYKTGHRPGTTAQQWAFARVNSFVTKSSGTWGKADKDLADKVRASEEVEVQETELGMIPKKKRKGHEVLGPESVQEWFESNQTRASYQLRHGEDWWWKLQEVKEAMLEKTGACCDDCADGIHEETELKEKGPCWDGFKQVGMKMKGGKQVPNCVPESWTQEDIDENLRKVKGTSNLYEPKKMTKFAKTKSMLDYLGKRDKKAAEKRKKDKNTGDYKMRMYNSMENAWGEVTEKDDKSGKELNNPTRGDVKKYKVYVKNDKGNVVKVEFGDPNMSIKRDDPEARKAFRARHNCDQKKDKTTAGYWSCKFWSTKSVTDLMKG